MDQRDEHVLYPRFYFLVYAGGELTQGSVCGAISGEVIFRPPAKAGDHLRASDLGCGAGSYHFAFKTKDPEALPCYFEATYYSGVAWAVAHLLERLGSEYPKFGPYIALPCSPMEDFW
jgi:hypothetical protein